jgi:hypothetical protein
VGLAALIVPHYIECHLPDCREVPANVSKPSTEAKSLSRDASGKMGIFFH